MNVRMNGEKSVQRINSLRVKKEKKMTTGINGFLEKGKLKY